MLLYFKKFTELLMVAIKIDGNVCLVTNFISVLKGTHTISLSSSLYITNQKPMIHRTHFQCIPTWVASSSG